MKSGIPVAVNFQVMQSFMTVALPLPFFKDLGGAPQEPVMQQQPQLQQSQAGQPAQTMQPVQPTPGPVQPLQPTPVQSVTIPTPQPPEEENFGDFSVAAPAPAPVVEDNDEVRMVGMVEEASDELIIPALVRVNLREHASVQDVSSSTAIIILTYYPAHHSSETLGLPKRRLLPPFLSLLLCLLLSLWLPLKLQPQPQPQPLLKLLTHSTLSPSCLARSGRRSH
jgi:hypothetical protein